MKGQVLGHYRVLEQIGTGGMGEVYRARDERLGRDVALKFVHPSTAKDADRLRRFELEARAAAALNHPNIVAIYDIGMHDGMPFIVSELLEGKTLRERLADGPLPVSEACDFGLQIAEGLTAAHEKHIVHRDLKPENLFVTKQNLVKILDFGIAKLIHPETAKTPAVQSLTTQTRTGSVLGTVAYMSPEQLRGKSVDGRSDIFSLGAILYEMLSGRRAFRGETDVDTITAVLRETPPEVTHERASVTPAFERVVNHCLEKEPEARFQSARDLAFALQNLSDGRHGRSFWHIDSFRVRKIVLGALAAALLGCGWFASSWVRRGAAAPEYHRLTFEEGTVYSARFASDGRSVVFEASWNGNPPRLFSTVSASPQTQQLDLADAHLLAVSKTNQMALQLRGLHGTSLDYTGGTLAQAPLAGGAPRELLEDVRWADWDPSPQSQLAVVHTVDGHSRLEFPQGKVLYESPGSITNVRFSPSGDKIAFMDHPVLWDDRGVVKFVDVSSGRLRTLSSEWESEAGLAWNPKGDEVWFTAIQAGYNRKLMAVGLNGGTRLILTAPEGINLQDVAPDGRVLVSIENQRVALEATAAPDYRGHDLSWYDWSVVKDISADGQWVLFEESGEPFEGRYAVSVRGMNGAPIHLGDGSAGGLSPDDKWALDVATADPPRVTLLPIGPGTPKDVPLPGLEHVQNGSARFMPDGKHILVNANEPGHLVRGILLDLDGGKPRPVTPEGIAAFRISPDGHFVAAHGPNASLVICDADAGKVAQIPGIEPGDTSAQWSADSEALYVYHFGEMPARIFRLDIHTGKRTLVRELEPSQRAGVVSIAPIVMSPDATRFAYSYYQNLSTLYVISGLK